MVQVLLTCQSVHVHRMPKVWARACLQCWMPVRYGTSTFRAPTHPCWMLRVYVCVVCACANPSGNDSEMTGPVGIVQRCHFQVPVSTFLLSLSVTQWHTRLCVVLESIEAPSGACFWCSPPLYLERKLQTLISTLHPSRINATHVQRYNRWMRSLCSAFDSFYIMFCKLVLVWFIVLLVYCLSPSRL